jgi:hypothetical protein
MNSNVVCPSFFCVGAQKSGTTALHHYLSQHPDVYLPSVKESHFFDDGHGEWRLGLDHYLRRYFGSAPAGALAGEIDPEYLFFPEVAGRLAGYFPNARLLFVLREPVARAYSHYWMTVRRGREPLDFAAALAAEPGRMGGDHLTRSDFSYASRGHYAVQIQRYLDHFSREQMLFLFSDDLKRNPASALDQVYGFLGLQPIPYRPISDEESHQAYMPISMGFQGLLDERSKLKKFSKALLPGFVRRPMMDLLYQVQERNRKPFKPPPMDPASKARLQDEFAADIDYLQELTGNSLGAWRTSRVTAPLP